ncbi:MFS transporter [Purpureocillium lilacinum]|uniref:MFS transporter n=1 Tax=Purpureocillium lilacinum TaxID=33203 RepID=A0A179GKC1_PURLI|nr:MFS transporter [Purpureocillium lilacinum]OAQ77948.1 MFS transporter [Purpureocillium lilacinum]
MANSTPRATNGPRDGVALYDTRQTALTPQQETAHVSASHYNDHTELPYEYPTALPLYLVLTSVTLAYFLFFLDLAVISTATPAITSQFDSLVDVGWYGGAYQLGSAAFQPLTGKLYSQFSTKWTFLLFFIIFEIGSAICGAAQSSAMFIVGRVISGVGSAGVANGALTIIAAVLPRKRQPLFMGVNMGIGQLGLATGPIIGGAFTSHASWRWCFYINLPLGVVVGGFLLFNTIPEPKPKRPALQVLGTAVKSLDLPGFFLICPSAVMFLLGLQYGGNNYPWDSSVVIGLLAGAAVTFCLFIAWERRQGDEAMVPFTMLKHRVIWSAAMTMFFSLSSTLVADFYIAIYFQAILNDSPLMSGVHMLPVTLGMVLFTMISGVLISVPYIAIQNLVPAEQIPLAMAIIIFTQNIGAATSLIAANAIFSNSLRHELQQRAEQIGRTPDAIVAAAYSKSIDHVMYLGIGVSVAGLVFAWGLGWTDIRKIEKPNAIISDTSDAGEKDPIPTVTANSK